VKVKNHIGNRIENFPKEKKYCKKNFYEKIDVLTSQAKKKN
jgi:hypothetical protein